MTADPAIGSLAERSAQGVIELEVSDLDTSVAFYRSLGFSLERRHGGFMSLTGHGCRLFLVQAADIPSPTVSGCNLRIIVDDLERIWSGIRDAGGLVVREPGDRPYGLRDFIVRDPDGFQLRFAQLLP